MERAMFVWIVVVPTSTMPTSLIAMIQAWVRGHILHMLPEARHAMTIHDLLDMMPERPLNQKFPLMTRASIPQRCNLRQGLHEGRGELGSKQLDETLIHMSLNNLRTLHLEPLFYQVFLLRCHEMILPRAENKLLKLCP